MARGRAKSLVLIHLSCLLSLRPHTSHTRSVRAHARGPPPYVFAFARGVGTKGQKAKRSQAPPSPAGTGLLGKSVDHLAHTGDAETHHGRPWQGLFAGMGFLPTSREQCVPGPARGLGDDWGFCDTCRRAPNLRCARCLPLPAIPSHGKLACGHHLSETGVDWCSCPWSVSGDRPLGAPGNPARPPPKPVACLLSAARRPQGESWAR